MSKKIRITKRMVANSYRRAAKFFDKHPEKWGQGRYRFHSADGEKFCAIGAQRNELINTLMDAGLTASTEEKEELFHQLSGGFDLLSAPMTYMERIQFMKRFGLKSDSDGGLILLNDSYSGSSKTIASELRKIARAIDHGAPVSKYLLDRKFEVDQ